MTSLMDDVLAVACSPMLDEQFGETGGVTLSRGPLSTPGVVASILSRGGEVIDSRGLSTQVLDATWLIRKERYLVGGNVVEPQEHDKLTPVANGAWSVLRIDGGQAALPWGADGSYWEIRTKRVA